MTVTEEKTTLTPDFQSLRYYRPSNPLDKKIHSYCFFHKCWGSSQYLRFFNRPIFQVSCCGIFRICCLRKAEQPISQEGFPEGQKVQLMSKGLCVIYLSKYQLASKLPCLESILSETHIRQNEAQDFFIDKSIIFAFSMDWLHLGTPLKG